MGDMGFSERAHPELSSQVRKLVDKESNGPAGLSHEKEEDIATTLVNELLQKQESTPVASGSQSKEAKKEREEKLPGGWN